MFSIRLDRTIERRLAHLASKAGRSKLSIVPEAILGYLEDREDSEVAMERLRKSRRIDSAQAVKRELGVIPRPQA
jgi:predicted DNA-binding protein